MFGVSEPMDFSERIWTSLSLASLPTYSLASLMRLNAVGSAANAARLRTHTASVATNNLRVEVMVVFMRRSIGSALAADNRECSGASTPWPEFTLQRARAPTPAQAEA